MKEIKLNEKIDEVEKEVERLKKQSNILAVLRLLFICLSIINLLIGYFQKKSMLYLLAAVCFFVFMILIVKHDRVKEKKQIKEAFLHIYKQHSLRMNGKWQNFVDDGKEFLNDNDYRSLDLDLLGQHSLYQMMNIAFTKKGKQRFADVLTQCDHYQNVIIQRQEAVRELASLPEFVYQLEAYGYLLDQKYESIIDDFVLQTSLLKLRKRPLYIFMITLITLLSLTLTIIQIGYPHTYLITEIGVVLQLCVALIFMMKHNSLFEPITKLNQSLQSYSYIFQIIHETTFRSAYLQSLQSQITQDGLALKAMKQLSYLSQRMQYRHNIFAFFILNAFGLYDLWIYNQYVDWLQTYHKDIQKWFDSLADLEALMSLSVLKIDHYDVIIPDIVEQEKLELSFKDIRHPLIDKQKVIGNDFDLLRQINIITGSNMSGKTTFMRSISLNLVLAYAGGYVFAKELKCSYMHILTSMRVKDNVEEGVSTFYGELLRIKEMISYSQKQQPMICFIDEIFKGTNSLDRIAGAKGALQKLSLSHCLVFLTTHDFELCQIDHILCQNYHFNEYYKDNEIYFDYLLQQGQSHTTNGQFLLKQLGIIE